MPSPFYLYPRVGAKYFGHARVYLPSFRASTTWLTQLGGQRRIYVTVNELPVVAAW